MAKATRQLRLKFHLKGNKRPESVRELLKHGAVYDRNRHLRLTDHQLDRMKHINRVFDALVRFKREKKLWRFGEAYGKYSSISEVSPSRLAELADREAGFQTVPGWKNCFNDHHRPFLEKYELALKRTGDRKLPSIVPNSKLMAYKKSVNNVENAIIHGKNPEEIIALKETMFDWEHRLRQEAEKMEARLGKAKK